MKCSDKTERLINMKFRVSTCKKFANVFKDDNNKKLLIVFTRCKSPFCPDCAQFERKKLYMKLKHKDLSNYRFLTLTLKKSDDLESDYKRINKCFTKFISLLKKKIFKNKCKKLEYFKMVEMGKNNNLHLHVLVNFYLDVKKISALWQIVTEDSYIVYVSRIKKKQELINYVIKYFLKAFDSHSDFFALKRKYSTSDLFFMSDKTQVKISDYSLVIQSVNYSNLYSTVSEILSLYALHDYDIEIINIPSIDQQRNFTRQIFDFSLQIQETLPF